MPTSSDQNLLTVLDNVLSAALKEVRKARALTQPPPTADSAAKKSSSRTAACRTVLLRSGGPLHVHALVAALAAEGISANRDSLVSALTKQLSPLGPFVRTAGNTFGLAGRDAPVDAP